MQHKATRQSRNANAAEKRHMSWIKQRMICAACKQEGPVINHHCEGSSFKNNKRQVGNLFVIGLCPCCDNIITRGSRRAFRDINGPQCLVWAKQFEEYPHKDDFSHEEIYAIVSYGK